jgi:hypothetical protein
MDEEKKDLPAPVRTPSRDHDHLAFEIPLDSSSDEEVYDDAEAPREEHHVISRVVTAQDWTGPDDPENPHNWPLGKRIWHTVQPGLFGFAVWVVP